MAMAQEFHINKEDMPEKVKSEKRKVKS